MPPVLIEKIGEVQNCGISGFPTLTAPEGSADVSTVSCQDFTPDEDFPHSATEIQPLNTEGSIAICSNRACLFFYLGCDKIRPELAPAQSVVVAEFA